MTFKDIKSLSGPEGGSRRLNDRVLEHERRLSSLPPLQFNCILSEIDVRDMSIEYLRVIPICCTSFSLIYVSLFFQLTKSQDILINYERCPIASGNFEIGLSQAIGLGVTKFSSITTNSATIVLPSPIQDILTTVVRDCNTVW